MLFNFFVEQRLSNGGVVHFAVAVAAIADEIDHYVCAEAVAVLRSEAGNANDGVHIFAVDVKDGDRLAARDAGGEPRGMFFQIAGGEAEQIVDDNMNGAADSVAGEIGVIHGFREDALSGKGGVAVNQQGQIFFAAAFSSAVLLGASAADSYGIDGFEVAG